MTPLLLQPSLKNRLSVIFASLTASFPFSSSRRSIFGISHHTHRSNVRAHPLRPLAESLRELGFVVAVRLKFATIVSCFGKKLASLRLGINRLQENLSRIYVQSTQKNDLLWTRGCVAC